MSSFILEQKVPDVFPGRINVAFDCKSERQMKGCQLGEHQIAPLPFVNVTIAEQTPVVAFAFGFGDEPCFGAAGIEVSDEDFRIQSFPILRADGMTLEFRDDLFCEQFHRK